MRRGNIPGMRYPNGLFLGVISVSCLFFSGCGYYPLYVRAPSEIGSILNRTEPVIVVKRDSAACVDRLGEIGWCGQELRLEASGEVDDRLLREIARLRDAGRIRFDGLAVSDASRCSSACLCSVPAWPALRWAMLGRATFSPEAAPRFTPGFRGLTLEDTVTPSRFWTHVADSDLDGVSFAVDTATLREEPLFRLKSRAGDMRYDLFPKDAASVDELPRVVAKLRDAGETRLYGWVDAGRVYHPL